jgi:peptidoglycan/LPS O-acetylase OafA/YrhL
MSTTERRYDIDWLRVIAIGLLILYHIGFVFLPWGVFIGFIQNEESIQWLWNPMSLVNIWRIPFLFFVSGMGVSFAIIKRSWSQLILERSRRILLPFLFGIFAIVPMHLFIWQKFYNQDLSYSIQVSHLWFLANIFIYVVLLSPLFFYVKRNSQGKISQWIEKLFSNPMGLLVVLAAFVIEAIWVSPEVYETYAMTLHGFLLGLLAFLFGFLFIQSGDLFWQTVKRWRWIFLMLAVLLFVVRYVEFQLQAPNYLKAIESNLWIFALFGFGTSYLNHQSRTLSYLSQSAYPIYILHMLFLYVGSYLLIPLGIPGAVKLILLILITFAGCFAMYELVIRRVRFLRPLFGLLKGKS